MTGRALAQPAVHLGDEGVDQIERHEGLDGTAKAAAVNTNGATAVEHMLGKSKRVHGRLLGTQFGDDILQVHGRAGAGLARQDQELVNVAGVQGRPALIDQAVLVPVVNGTQAGAVAQLGTQLGELGVKVGNVYLAQACLAKLGGDVCARWRRGARNRRHSTGRRTSRSRRGAR